MASQRLFPRQISGYPLPNLLTSEEDWRRTYNQDVREMDAQDLQVELSRVKRAYVVAYKQRVYIRTAEIHASVSADDWLYSRARVIERELLARSRRRSK